jgi:hypothetical protein
MARRSQKRIFVELNNASFRKKGAEGARVALKFEEKWIY